MKWRRKANVYGFRVRILAQEIAKQTRQISGPRQSQVRALCLGTKNLATDVESDWREQVSDSRFGVERSIFAEPGKQLGRFTLIQEREVL